MGGYPRDSNDLKVPASKERSIRLKTPFLSNSLMKWCMGPRKYRLT